ncbi:hypothetical protein EV426DRAFT_300767 [Tirmania nivea]|nr:hypothetical protein EV426DRAFT_300767 [Tirmania nivea]
MHFHLAIFLALSLTSALSLANPVPQENDSFQALVRDADDTALHAALHAKKEYKHGIFPHDRHALEAVHREHAEEALQIVKFALIRRQDNSTTTVTSTTTTRPALLLLLRILLPTLLLLQRMEVLGPVRLLLRRRRIAVLRRLV